VEESRPWASNWIMWEEGSREREQWLQWTNYTTEAKKAEVVIASMGKRPHPPQ
jgi:hypothetical protein